MKKESEKRSTRGKRIRELSAEEIEADQEFWALDNDVWKDADSDDSFSSDDSESDQYDSDFDESEDDNDEDEDEIRKEDDREFRKSKSHEKGSKNTNRYVDPAKAKKSDIGNKNNKNNKNSQSNSNSSSSSSSSSNDRNENGDSMAFDSVAGADGDLTAAALPNRKKKRRQDSNMSLDNILDDVKSVGSISSGRSVRNSTKWKSQDTEMTQKMEDLARRKNVVVKRPVIKHQYSQQELLLESLDTEVESLKWLEMQKLIAADMSVSAEKRGHAATSANKAASFIKKVSRKGQNDTITFTSVEDMPLILRQSDGAPSHSNSNHSSNSSSSKKSKKAKGTLCVITGLPAKYRDPKTMLPYATIEAYNEIKRKFHKKLQDGDKNKGGAISRTTSQQSFSSFSSKDTSIQRTSSNQSLSSASKDISHQSSNGSTSSRIPHSAAKSPRS